MVPLPDTIDNIKRERNLLIQLASIFVRQGLSYRASFDKNEDLKKFSTDLENA